MSYSPVQGRNVILRAKRVDNIYYGFYCAQEVRISFQTDQVAATGPNVGSFRRFKPGRTSWSVDFTGVAFMKTNSDSSWEAYELTDEQARMEGLDLLITFTDDAGNTQTFSGHANPETTQIFGRVAKLAGFEMKFQGDGAYARNASISQDEINDVNRYEYVASGGETSFDDAILINRTILDIEREALPAVHVITSGTPGPKQVKYTSSTGEFAFDGNPAGTGEQFVIIYR
jgi:hypothetical protein